MMMILQHLKKIIIDWLKHSYYHNNNYEDKGNKVNEICSLNNTSTDNDSPQNYQKCLSTPEQGQRMDWLKYFSNNKSNKKNK